MIAPRYLDALRRFLGVASGRVITFRYKERK